MHKQNLPLKCFLKVMLGYLKKKKKEKKIKKKQKKTSSFHFVPVSCSATRPD